jgi:hypothetical protein
MHAHPLLRQYLCGHQACRAAPDNSDLSDKDFGIGYRGMGVGEGHLKKVWQRARDK